MSRGAYAAAARNPPKKTGPRKQEAPLDRNAKKEQVAAAAPNGMQERGKKRAGGATGATRPTHTTRSSIPTCPRRGCERRPGRYAVALQGTSKGIGRRADDQLYRQVEYERQRKVDRNARHLDPLSAVYETRGRVDFSASLSLIGLPDAFSH